MEPNDLARMLALVVLLALALVGVLLPLFVRNNIHILSLGNCFSAGVLLSAGVVHMIPNAAATCKIVSEETPVASLLFGVGFFGVLSAEVFAIHMSGRGRKHAYSRVGKDDSSPSPGVELVTVSHVRAKHSDIEDEVEVEGEGHTAADLVGREGMGLLTSLVLLVVLSLHSVMDGLVIGVGVVFPVKLFLAVFLHKIFGAFALGMSLVKSNMFEKQRKLFIVSVVTFCLATPLGILLGMMAGTALGGFGECLFVALASGTFVYVSLLEVLAKEMEQHKLGPAKLLTTIAGFIFMSAIGLIEDD